MDLDRVLQKPVAFLRAQVLPRPGVRPIVSLLLLSLGLALSLYVAGSYAWMYQQQRELRQQWKTQNLTSSSSPAAGGPARLLIPKIDLDVMIAEGASRRSLALGPGHLSNTAEPGDSGNAVIAAHRDTFFRHLNQLEPGDDIYVQRGGQRYHYIVSGKRVVAPSDLSVLHPASEGRLTLITCYPTHFIGPAPQRLVVSARLIQPALLPKASSPANYNLYRIGAPALPDYDSFGRTN